MKHYTRFRAYQLGTCGASFSISVDRHFTLIEARFNNYNSPHILWEMRNLGIDRIDTLHITSWDADHCSNAEIDNLLFVLNPKRIEMPGYKPHSNNAIEAKKKMMQHSSEKIITTPQLVKLTPHKTMFGEDVLYNPTCNCDKSNDNSVVKFFRIGSFTVLSLGDCESEQIRDALMADEILQKEVDILILSHHGADNGFTTLEFLRALNPKIAICASDYGNKYGHPDDVITQRLRTAAIDYYSTKTGDVIAQSLDKYSFKVSNYISNDTALGAVSEYTNKTYYIND